MTSRARTSLLEAWIRTSQSKSPDNFHSKLACLQVRGGLKECRRGDEDLISILIKLFLFTSISFQFICSYNTMQ